MAIEKRLEFEIEHKFDAKNSRPFPQRILHGAFHCHHFATLYTQLADDAKDFHGERLLKEASEDTFFHVLSEYFCANNITRRGRHRIHFGAILESRRHGPDTIHRGGPFCGGRRNGIFTRGRRMVEEVGEP